MNKLIILKEVFYLKKNKNLKKLLNLNILDYTNLTSKFGDYDMPYIVCDSEITIDYIALYGQPCTYHKTQNTCVSFFEYDTVFDGLYGLWNAIYYDVKELQEYYIERFEGVKYFISPDYSKCGDSVEVENRHRQFKSRIVSIWLVMKLNAIVVPLVSTANSIGMRYMLDGMHDCSIVAFNAKGPMGNPEQLKIFIESINYTVDHLPKLEKIVVYTVSTNEEKLKQAFKYAIERGIEIIIPDNMLLSRNRIYGGDKNDIR